MTFRQAARRQPLKHSEVPNMKILTFSAMVLAVAFGMISSVYSQQTAPATAASAPVQPIEVTCFESRKGASEVVKRDISAGVPNVKCSPKTGAVLWWSDPFDGTVPMGNMPQLDHIPAGKAVVKPRSEKLALMPSRTCAR